MLKNGLILKRNVNDLLIWPQNRKIGKEGDMESKDIVMKAEKRKSENLELYSSKEIDKER